MVIGDPDGVGIAGGEECKDRITVFIKLSQGVIDVNFQAEGCPLSVAGASAVCEMASGKDIFFAARLKEDDVATLLDFSPDDYDEARCLSLGLVALRGAIENFMGRRSRAGKSLYPARDRRVAVAMSGGVDSSVAALILKEQGFEVFGLTARLLTEEVEVPSRCCSPSEIADARNVCESLEIPHFTVDLSNEFKSLVIDPFCADYLDGKTPNPCVECNGKIRFGPLLDVALSLGAERLATGHYVRIERLGNKYRIKRASDTAKDQSYLFWQADQKVLAQLLAPLGGLSKNEVRSIARKANLPTANKEESQEICFIPDDDYRSFLLKNTDYIPVPGPLVDKDGKEIGKHKGYAFYTVGQRKGLGIAYDHPLYVTKIDPEKNTLEVGARNELDRKVILATKVNYINGLPEPLSNIRAMTRYRSRLITASEISADSRSIELHFQEETGPISPGQSLVLFEEDKLIGGGIIA